MSSIPIRASRELISSASRGITPTKLCLLWGGPSPSSNSVYCAISTDCNGYNCFANRCLPHRYLHFLCISGSLSKRDPAGHLGIKDLVLQSFGKLYRTFWGMKLHVALENTMRFLLGHVCLLFTIKLLSVILFTA